MPKDGHIEELIGGISNAMEQMQANHKQVIDDILAARKQDAAEQKETIAAMNKIAEEQLNHSKAIVELEQELANKVVKGHAPVATLGECIIKSDEFKQFAQGNTQRMRIQANTITGQEGSPAENADTLVAPQRVPDIVAGAFKKLRIKELVAQGQTTSNAVEYAKESAFTNNAAETAEGAAKPENDITFT